MDGRMSSASTIQTPTQGQVAAFTDTVPYTISVTDPEDGTTGAGISCNDVHVTVSLGHDQHSHGLSQQTGCTGTFKTGLTSGHGAMFSVVAHAVMSLLPLPPAPIAAIFSFSLGDL